jgi:hypothetical protein
MVSEKLGWQGVVGQALKPAHDQAAWQEAILVGLHPLKSAQSGSR